VKVKGKIIGSVIVDKSLIEPNPPCDKCEFKDTWICKRFFTLEDILPYVLGRRIICVEFSSHEELKEWAVFWLDELYRRYGWDVIPIASYHCDLCGNPKKYCLSEFCGWRILESLKEKGKPKGGYKKFWWCSYYLYIRLPVEFRGYTRMCYLVRNQPEYSHLPESLRRILLKERREWLKM